MYYCPRCRRNYQEEHQHEPFKVEDALAERPWYEWLAIVVVALLLVVVIVLVIRKLWNRHSADRDLAQAQRSMRGRLEQVRDSMSGDMSGVHTLAAQMGVSGEPIDARLARMRGNIGGSAAASQSA